MDYWLGISRDLYRIVQRRRLSLLHTYPSLSHLTPLSSNSISNIIGMENRMYRRGSDSGHDGNRAAYPKEAF